MDWVKKVGRRIKQKIRTFLGIHTTPSSQEYVNYLRGLGCRIGERVVIFAPGSTTIDITRPYLIEIGNDVQIPYGVSILTHGYDWSVLKGMYGDVLGSSGKVKIGNNVFIGAKTTILKGVTIGNNVIIGAESVVNKDIPNNCVAVGNPCRVIMSCEEYYEKRKKAQLEEASELVREYRKVYGKNPGKSELSEFFFLFSNEEQEIEDSWKQQMSNLGNYEETLKKFKEHEPMFASMEDFLNSVV